MGGNIAGERFKFDFSIVLYNIENCIEDSIKSIIGQTFGSEKIQIVFIDDGTSQNQKIAFDYQKRYPQNFFIIKNDEDSKYSSLNLALNHCQGEYINFLNSGDLLSDNSLREVYSFFNKISNLDVVNIAEYDNGKPLFDYDFTNHNCIIDLSLQPEFINSALSSFFIKKDFINVKFNENLPDSTDLLFIDEILINSKLGFVKKAKVDKNSSNYSINRYEDMESFLDKINYYYNGLFDCCNSRLGYVPNYIQYKIAIELGKIVKTEDVEDILCDGLSGKEAYILICRLLDYINVSNIKGNEFIDNHTQNFLVFLKNRDFNITIEENKDVVFYSGNQVLNVLSRQNLWMDIIEIKGDYINFSGSITSYCEYEHMKIEAIKDVSGKSEIIPVEFVEYTTTDRKVMKYLSTPWVYSYNFDVEIPLKDCRDCKIYFRFTYMEDGNKITIKPNIKLRKYASLSVFSHYFIKDSRIVLFSLNSFNVMPYSWKKAARFELSSIKKILTSNRDKKISTIAYKGLYLALLPYMKNKEIWLFADRRESADDNSEHLFKYSIKQKDNVKKYFIINKDSPDYKRLKKISRNVVGFGTLKHKLLFTFSDKLISSQVNKFVLNPFLRQNDFLYNGAVLHDECFIQHGVILHDLSSWIRKYLYNLSLFVTSAEAEWESIAHTTYNYKTDRIQLLGLPRYDKLVDNSKNQILFIPTWRRDLDDPHILINSKYFNDINSFLNNERLFELADEYEYSIVFKPHPELWRYIDLFDIPKDVRISHESYSQLFSESSVMITDYSSIAFDFAYLQKPLIYYQNQDFADFHYEKGYFDYETMGFGEIIKTEEDLIDKIEFYMKNGSVLEDEYKKRSDSFFKFHDRNNSKRIYEWLIRN